jgi:hypothetical protein
VRLDPVQSPGKALSLGSIVPTPSTSLRAALRKLFLSSRKREVAPRQ